MQRQICLQTTLRKPVENFGVLKTSVKQPQEQSKTLRLGLLMQGAGFGVPCLAQGAEFSGAVACQTFLP
jgi:hypothetical protein